MRQRKCWSATGTSTDGSAQLWAFAKSLIEDAIEKGWLKEMITDTAASYPRCIRQPVYTHLPEKRRRLLAFVSLPSLQRRP